MAAPGFLLALQPGQPGPPLLQAEVEPDVHDGDGQEGDPEGPLHAGCMLLNFLKGNDLEHGEWDEGDG